MALSKEQLQKMKQVQALAQDHCERIGGKLAHPINFDLLELNQEKQPKVELDQKTMKDIQEQVKKQVEQAIDNGLKDLFK